MNKLAPLKILFCAISVVLTGCVANVAEKIQIRNFWSDGQSAFLYYSQLKELETGSMLNVHGDVREISRIDWLVPINGRLANESISVEVNGARKLADVLFASKELIILGGGGNYKINENKTNIGIACPDSSGEGNLIVFGSKFYHCGKIVDWVNGRDLGLPKVVARELGGEEKNSTYAFFSNLAKKTLILVRPSRDELGVLIFAEFDENFSQVSHRKLDLQCAGCSLTVVARSVSFFGNQGYLVTDNISPNRVEHRTWYCGPINCQQRDPKAGWPIVTISGSPPGIFKLSANVQGEKPNNFVLNSLGVLGQ